MLTRGIVYSQPVSTSLYNVLTCTVYSAKICINWYSVQPPRLDWLLQRTTNYFEFIINMQRANLLGYLNFILPACSISCAVGNNPRQPVLAGDDCKQACTDGWPVHTSLYWLAVSLYWLAISTGRPVMTCQLVQAISTRQPILIGNQCKPICTD